MSARPIPSPIIFSVPFCFMYNVCKYEIINWLSFLHVSVRQEAFNEMFEPLRKMKLSFYDKSVLQKSYTVTMYNSVTPFPPHGRGNKAIAQQHQGKKKQTFLGRKELLGPLFD